VVVARVTQGFDSLILCHKITEGIWMTKLIEKYSARIIEWVGSAASLIVHTLLFVVIFGLKFFGYHIDQILLILTTVVSLEAIYLAIFNQMTLNKHTRSINEVGSDVRELQTDVEEILEENEV
jgi:hypothetical protein